MASDDLKLIVGDRVAVRRFAFFLQHRSMILAGKEPPPSLRQVRKGLATGIAMNGSKPRKLVTFYRIELLFENLGIGTILGGTLSVPFDQYPVLHKPSSPGGRLNVSRLIRRRFTPVLVRSRRHPTPPVIVHGHSAMRLTGQKKHG